MIREIYGWLFAVIAVGCVAVLLAAEPASATTRCPGSLDSKGRYVKSKRGILRDYYARNTSCAAARTLLGRGDDVGEPITGRGGTGLQRVQVPGGSLWRCRLRQTVNGRPSPFGLVPDDAKTVFQSVSCRPLNGRPERRVTARTRNFADES